MKSKFYEMKFKNISNMYDFLTVSYFDDNSIKLFLSLSN